MDSKENLGGPFSLALAAIEDVKKKMMEDSNKKVETMSSNKAVLEELNLIPRKKKNEKDLKFLKEMRQHFYNGRRGIVRQMMDDWIDELETTDLRELSANEMEDIRGGVEKEQVGEAFTTWPQLREAVNEITGKD